MHNGSKLIPTRGKVNTDWRIYCTKDCITARCIIPQNFAPNGIKGTKPSKLPHFSMIWLGGARKAIKNDRKPEIKPTNDRKRQVVAILRIITGYWLGASHAWPIESFLPSCSEPNSKKEKISRFKAVSKRPHTISGFLLLFTVDSLT